MTTILIVEDDLSLNKGLTLTLARSGLNVRQAFDITGAERILSAEHIDLMILDIHLPDGSGLDLCEKIRHTSAIPIIILTANDMEPDIVTGFELGCDDYITKPFSLMILRARVMAVLRRFNAPHSEQFQSGSLTFDFGKLEYYKDNQQLILSRTEQKLLKILITNSGNILTREQLIDKIWTENAEFVDENSLTVAIKRLRSKIEDNPSSPQYIKTIYGLGYMWTKGKNP